MCECNKDSQDQDSDVPLKVFLEQFSLKNPEFFAHFSGWLTSSADMDPNWKFWVNFVFRDAFSYFFLIVFFSIRSGIWDLRLYGIKRLGH